MTYPCASPHPLYVFYHDFVTHPHSLISDPLPQREKQNLNDKLFLSVYVFACKEYNAMNALCLVTFQGFYFAWMNIFLNEGLKKTKKITGSKPIFKDQLFRYIFKNRE